MSMTIVKPAPIQVGETWTRNRFEVHEQGTNGKWFITHRTAVTLEEAKAQIAEQAEGDKALRPFIDLGQRGARRIVKVEAVLTRVA